MQGIANGIGRSFLVHFGFGHYHILEFQFAMCLLFVGGEKFVMSLLFAGGEKPTFKTNTGRCVAQPKGFASKECREWTFREGNIDLKDGVAMATAKKVTKLLVIFRQCVLDLPQRVPTAMPQKGAYHSGR